MGKGQRGPWVRDKSKTGKVGAERDRCLLLFDSPRLGGSPGVWDPKSVRRVWCGLQHSSPRWSCKRGSAGGAAGRCEGEGSRTFGEGSRPCRPCPCRPMLPSMPRCCRCCGPRCPTIDDRSVGHTTTGGRRSAIVRHRRRSPWGGSGGASIDRPPLWCPISTVPPRSTVAVRALTARIGVRCRAAPLASIYRHDRAAFGLARWRFPYCPPARLGSARLLPGSASLGLQLTQPSPFARYVKPPR
jgi:hypothetical protein